MKPVVPRTVNLPVPLAEWLVEEARRRGVTVSELIREALEEKRADAGVGSRDDR